MANLVGKKSNSPSVPLILKSKDPRSKTLSTLP